MGRRRARPAGGCIGLAMMLLVALAVGLLIGLLIGALLGRIGLEPFVSFVHPSVAYGSAKLLWLGPTSP